MAKRTRKRPILGMGPAFVDALQARAGVEPDTTGIAFISLGGGIDGREIEAYVAAYERLFPPVTFHLIEVGPDYPEADLGIMDHVIGTPNLGSKAVYDNDEHVMVVPFYTDSAVTRAMEDVLDLPLHGPATEDEMAGVMRTLARGRNEPDDRSGLVRMLSRGR